MVSAIGMDAEKRMKNNVESLSIAFAKIRTGRANPRLLDAVRVSYYGSEMQLSQVANISTEDARTLSVRAWERAMVPEIEKAILKSDLGLNPSTAGDVIRIPLPALTEETRKGFIRQARQEAESARISVRNVRRDAMSNLKNLEKEKEISEDEERCGQDNVQKLTNMYIAKIEKLLVDKESDLIEI
ncbi:MAG: ribosome recycling factor [Candidatus Endonucleobacter bathymodioli]|uniref:Ribosome-recycling factor n=1 Tax=Candidatus Endonucleibacter bathymodioli TaxID=539814 RepID=A0AA90NNE0_9GAMM|nr:ribosome recycling factor [Candidatus Endonucleobacter bathymodioli]